MPLASVQVDNVRCIQQASLDLAPRLTLIQGPNGSGKTSLLEAIHLAGRGRSFRTRNTERLIRRGATRLQVYAETSNPAHRIGFAYDSAGAYQARLDGRTPGSLAELPSALFVEVIDPDIHRLVEGAPAERRRWLDWGVFHVEPSFLAHWLRYSRALRQRNAALRDGQPPEPWNGELVAAGEALHAQRVAWFESLAPHWARVSGALLDTPVDLALRSGWAADLSLGDALHSGLERDRQRGSTLAGPHRADIVLRARGASARDVLSRGQQKLTAAGLVLALLGRLRAEQQALPTLLLDDPAAELDAGRLHAFVEEVRALDCQIVMTSLSANTSLFGAPERVFHVEQGHVERVY